MVPHQANKRIIDAIAKRIGLADDKVMSNIEYFGNTTAATLPLLLKEIGYGTPMLFLHVVMIK